ncbi:MAG: VOC family protein [Pseudomonadota bacterium]
MTSNQLTPEFAVRDIAKSLAFYCELLGFKLEYQRPEEGFALVSIDEAQLMLDQIGMGRTFGDELQNKHLGLGLNVQIFVEDDVFSRILEALEAVGYPLYLELEEKWYRKDNIEVGNKQFLVGDPDGYLLRFAVNLGSREL